MKKGDSSMIQGEGVVVGILRCELKGENFFFLVHIFPFEYYWEEPKAKRRRGFPISNSPRGGI